jgi:lipopolysaccharide biosynthesis protein
VHDKVSPHSIDGHSWKNNLQKIIDYKNYWQILAVFKQDDKIGVVGAIEHLINEYDRTNGTFINNSDRTHEFLKKYNITISNYDFIGGTMYWMKAPIIEKFFTKYHPLQIRSELEAGNVMDNHGSTNAHTWERVLSWIATNQGYKVYGI